MFLGAPTVERHEHFDLEGRLTGSTVVTRESPWDEDSRDAARALHYDELERCPECNGPRADCEDPDVPWFPQRLICWKTAASNVVHRRWQAKHEDAQPDSAGYLPTDGARIWLSKDDLTPDDDFL